MALLVVIYYSHIVHLLFSFFLLRTDSRNRKGVEFMGVLFSSFFLAGSFITDDVTVMEIGLFKHPFWIDIHHHSDPT